MSAAALALPVVQWLLIIVAVVVAAIIGEWCINWLDGRDQRRSAPMRTADANRIDRETQQLWQRWPDTMPPAEDPAPPRPHARAGAPTVVPFPSPHAERIRLRHLAGKQQQQQQGDRS